MSVIKCLIAMCTFAMFVTAYGQVPYLDEKCITCLCGASCIADAGCHVAGDGVKVCGPFYISYSYWKDAGKPVLGYDNPNRNGAFEACAVNRQCATKAIATYMKKYKQDCDGDGIIDCEDYARLHRLGPLGCKNKNFVNLGYYQGFSRCFNKISVGNYDYNSNEYAPRIHTTNIATNLATNLGQVPYLDEKCITCLCGAFCRADAGCHVASDGIEVCGPFYITYSYWRDAGKPVLGSGYSNGIGAYKACALNTQCATKAIRNYMKRYKQDCNGDGVINCEDYARIHRLGPLGCRNKNFVNLGFYQGFSKCFNKVSVVDYADNSYDYAPTNLRKLTRSYY